MINEKYKAPLLKLEETAKMQGHQINLSTIFNELKYETDEQQEILTYFVSLGIEILHTDVEPEGLLEDEKGSINNDIEPFDPTKIDIKVNQMTIDSIVKRIRHGEFDFNTSFQRKAGLWKKAQKSQLIESILLQIPLPSFYFDASDDDNWLIIDGLQRLSTIKEYIVEETLLLTGLEFLHEFKGKRFSELPRPLQRRIEETNINAYLVSPTTPKNVKFNIFKRLNTGGLALEAQEIRNALYQGKATKFIDELAKLDSFTIATDGSIKAERMQDRELCLRYVAFTELSLDKHFGKDLEEFLNNTMDYLNNLNDEKLDEIREKFDSTMKICREIFGKHAFRKMYKDDKRRPVNKALFDTWSYVISKLDTYEVEMLITFKKELKELVIDLFMSLFEDEPSTKAMLSRNKLLRFERSLKTISKEYVAYRFEFIESIVDQILF